MFKIYRIIHIIWTAIFAFFISIPILEDGFERVVYDDAFFVVLWIIGVVFLFIKKLTKIGFVLTIMPLLFAIFTFIF
ncbi:hypothetical protein [Lysinibacillus sp. SGAir0095]|uniref:hypothetical protein n=1 Tax=Lysinibacillus sp. SGAir0095 TaxID=2070463 RepID=UPI0010CD41BA|nr:hypothetical protein [Lysinibacillus sp. SGAir0095]QCR34100.1 hypothetical protein C1N55_19095 [Lysinibacillus sp. SGAir0095]